MRKTEVKLVKIIQDVDIEQSICIMQSLKSEIKIVKRESYSRYGLIFLTSRYRHYE